MLINLVAFINKIESRTKNLFLILNKLGYPHYPELERIESRPANLREAVKLGFAGQVDTVQTSPKWLKTEIPTHAMQTLYTVKNNKCCICAVATAMFFVLLVMFCWSSAGGRYIASKNRLNSKIIYAHTFVYLCIIQFYLILMIQWYNNNFFTPRIFQLSETILVHVFPNNWVRTVLKKVYCMTYFTTRTWRTNEF